MIKIYKTLNLFGSHNHVGQLNFNSQKKRRNPLDKIWKNIFDDNLHKAIERKKKSFKGLSLTVTSFSFIFFLGISTDFVTSQHKQENDLLCQFASYDVSPDLDIKRNTGESKIYNYYTNEEYEIAVDYGLRNFEALTYHDVIILANSYQKLGRIDKAIIVYEKLADVQSQRLKEFVEYKLAYLYLSNCDVKGLDLLDKIMSQDDHSYNDLAFRLNNFNPTFLLNSEVKKNKLLESLSIQ